VIEIEPSTRDDVTRLALSGELDLTGSEPVDEAVDAALAAGSSEILLDLTGTTFIDSAGVGALLSAQRRTDKGGATFRLISPPGSEGRLVIDLAGLAKLLNLETEPG
jgi:anti-sigma B factor antagonist